MIAITVTDDNTVEPAETIVLTLQGVVGDLLLGAVSRYEVSITDDDVPEVVFTGAGYHGERRGHRGADSGDAECGGLDGSDADAGGNTGGMVWRPDEYTLPATLTIARGDRRGDAAGIADR